MPSQERFELLTDYDPASAYNEAYHTLYANIRFNLDGIQEKSHTLLLTAASATAPQPSFAANVAIAAAQSGTATILVDADLRTPGLERRFGVEKGCGLCDLLQAAAITMPTLQQCLHRTFITNLQLLGAGSNSGSEGAGLLFSARLADCIAALRQHLTETAAGQAGMIIFHTPPVLTGPDASLVGSQADQTIIALVKGKTTRNQAKQAQEQLQRAHANLVGIVFLDA